MGQIPQNTHTLFVDAFLQNNRLDHVSQVMGYHPLYLDNFLKTQHFILRGDGPLPYDYRHYIAIMAAGRHQCSYLITLQKQEFILQGGDHKWLQGLNFIPPKLRNLYDINKILAHRPWLLNMSHIEKLTKGKDSWSLAEVVHAIVILAHFHSLCSFVFSCGVNQELDQAGGYRYPSNPPSNGINGAGIGGGGGGGHLTNGDSNPSENSNTTSLNLNNTSDPKDIIIGDRRQDWNNHHHSSTNTLPPILDPPPNPSSLPVSPLPPLLPPSPTNAEPEVAISTLMARMKTLSEQPQECSPGELAKRFEHVCEETNNTAPSSNNTITTVPAPVALTRATVVSNNKVVGGGVGSELLLGGERVVMNGGGGGKEDRGVVVVDGREDVLAQDLVQRADIVCGFVFDPGYGYQDFAKRGEPQLIPTFRVQDYSWDDHAYSLVNRLYNDVGNLLDDTFRTAYNLTYYTMGGRTDVDTSRFRRAIWNYIQCLLGVRHDDYDYGEINQLLERTLKTFIKGACCFPERVTKRDYDRVLREFKDSEKVHVNLMVLEARKQAELLYALRTVNKYMNN